MSPSTSPTGKPYAASFRSTWSANDAGFTGGVGLVVGLTVGVVGVVGVLLAVAVGDAVGVVVFDGRDALAEGLDLVSAATSAQPVRTVSVASRSTPAPRPRRRNMLPLPILESS